MATIKDLFKKQNKDLYGLMGKLFIESHGLINAPRAAALLTSSPDAIADAIGNQIGGALGGNPNRVSDTIFKNNNVFSKPISLGKTRRGLQDAVEAGKPYFVKDNPAPASLIAMARQGGTSPAGMAANLAVQAINKYGSKNGLKDLKNLFKKKIAEQNAYGSKYAKDDNNKLIKNDIIFSKYAPAYSIDKNQTDYTQAAIEGKERKNSAILNGKSQLDTINYKILSVLKSDKELSKSKLTDLIKSNEQIQTPYVLIKRYNKENDNILLPGTISGISDEATPEWSTFKFVGSPFNQYRYMGVERKLSFELKMYYTDNDTKLSMQKSLHKLRTLVYPEEDISVITYEKGGYTPLGFNGNFVYLTINGLYTDLFGFIETLSISIDDATPWATTSDNFMDGSPVRPYPTVINVSMGMTVISNPKIEDNKYVYNFTNPNDLTDKEWDMVFKALR
jgi:hypothetical protein